VFLESLKKTLHIDERLIVEAKSAAGAKTGTEICRSRPRSVSSFTRSRAGESTAGSAIRVAKGGLRRTTFDGLRLDEERRR
jgi:hypothetical protein